MPVTNHAHRAFRNVLTRCMSDKDGLVNDINALHVLAHKFYQHIVSSYIHQYQYEVVAKFDHCFPTIQTRLRKSDVTMLTSSTIETDYVVEMQNPDGLVFGSIVFTLKIEIECKVKPEYAGSRYVEKYPEHFDTTLKASIALGFLKPGEQSEPMFVKPITTTTRENCIVNYDELKSVFSKSLRAYHSFKAS